MKRRVMVGLTWAWTVPFFYTAMLGTWLWIPCGLGLVILAASIPASED